MSFRTRCTGALCGAFLCTIGAPMIFLDMRRNAERVISGTVDPLSRKVAKSVYTAGAAVPTLVLCGVTALLYPVVGWLAAPLTLALACAVGAAFGAVLLDLTEQAPLGTPGNPRPMPNPEPRCSECGDAGWVLYPGSEPGDYDRCYACADEYDMRERGPDIVAKIESGEITLADYKTMTRARLYGC